MTDQRKSSDHVVEPARHGPPGPEFDAYATLPVPTAIAQQLRQIQALAHDFEVHLGQALHCNPTDLSAMEHLVVSGPMSPGDLSRRLNVSSAAGSMVVDRLTGLGHAERRPHAEDRRRTVVHPAAESVTRTIEELRPIVEGVDAVVSRMDDKERAVVERFLADVIGVYASALETSRQPGAPGS